MTSGCSWHPARSAIRQMISSARQNSASWKRWAGMDDLPIADNVFLRVFFGVAGALLIYAVFAIAIFHFLNTTRYSDYREQRVTPLITWLAEDIRPRLDLLSAITGSSEIYALRELHELPLTGIQRERLLAGQSVVVPYHGGTQAFGMLATGEVLSILFSDLELETALWSTRLVSILSRQSDEALQTATVKSLARRLNLPLVLQPLDNMALWQLSLRQRFAQEGWTVFPINAQPDAGVEQRALAVALDDRQFLQLSPLPRFRVWAWPVLGTLVALALVCVGVTLHLLLQQIEGRLRKIETAANRISRGDMDARVVDQHVDAVGRLGSVFNSMADHIQRLVDVQREMIHAVSHELRTPVARIRFGIQMIEDFVDDKVVTKQLKGIDSDIQELNELIDEILTYARLEQGGPILDFQTTNVKDIVQQIVSEQTRIHQRIAIQANIQVADPRSVVSEVEPRYIHRSMQNLVGNAARYAKSQVQINASFGDETIRIDVEDDGPGVPEEDWERIFTPFARLDDSRTRSSGGYGLGLSIVRRILYWHGGQAFVGRSALGGAKFSLVWPRKQLSS